MADTQRSTSRRIRVARAVVALAATVAMVGGCGGDDTSAGPSGPEPTQPGAASPGDGAPSQESSPEVGTWETDRISRSAFLETLREADLQRYRRIFQTKEDWLPEQQAVMSLELRDGSLTLYASFDDRVPTIFDRQTYEIDGDRLVATSGVGRSVFRVTGDDGALTLTFVSSTEPDYQGVPVEAVLRTYYTADSFHRVAS